MKKIIKSIIFIVIFVILFNIASNILILKGNCYGTDVLGFYNEKKNSIDVLFLGSSHSYSTFSPYIIEEKTNMKAYNLLLNNNQLILLIII